MASLELCGINYIYNKGTPYETYALKDINLKLGGGIMGIIGHTGSGKSTLVQLLNGLLRPTEGKILLDGEDIWEKKTDRLREARFKVGLVMQYPEYQLFASTVYEDIAFGPRNMGLSDEEIKERVYAAAKFSMLSPEVMTRSPFELSGGQKRRVALAGIIAMNPKFLVLDEPVAGLDPGGRRGILEGICNFCKKSGASVIIVSHSMEDMAAYCDRVIAMASGKIVMDGSRSEVYGRADELIGIGLDVPQITRIAAALGERGIDIGRDVYTVGYAADKICSAANIRKNNNTN